MPWKECNVVDERLKFVARHLEGEKMAVLCRDFGISRKTGYKIVERYEETSQIAFVDCDASRSAVNHINPYTDGFCQKGLVGSYSGRAGLQRVPGKPLAAKR